MAYALRPLTELQLPGDLSRLRSHAAMIRALLDELDRVVPATGARHQGDPLFGVREQLVEELARLGCRLLECAATLTMAPPLPPPPARA